MRNQDIDAIDIDAIILLLRRANQKRSACDVCQVEQDYAINEIGFIIPLLHPSCFSSYYLSGSYEFQKREGT